MSLSYLFDPNKQFQDEAGNNNVDGFLRVYIDGTDDRAITYKDFDGTLNQSDITLDINGRAVVIVDRSKTYRLEVYKRDGGMLWTARPMIPSSEGGGGIDPEDLKDLVIKHGGRTSGTYRPMVGATIDIPKSCEAVSELEENLYGKITSIISDFRTPVLMKSDLDPEIPGVTRDFYYWPTARTGADGNYSFVGNDGVRTEIATVHDDNSVTYTTIEVPTASTSIPSMDGTASAGSSTQWSRGDHVHPTDTSREAAANKTTTVRQNGQADNTKFPTEAAVRTAIDSAVSSAYHASGTKTVAQLTSSLLVSANEGDVYNITDSGTTTSDFIEGAGHPISAGDNVVVCDVGGGVYKFDLLSGFVDLTNYLTKTGDGSDVTATFTAASTRTNVSTGEKLSVLFGKIAKWFGDFKALAFKDKVTDSDISGTISDAHIASASTWNGKQDAISTDTDSSTISDSTTIATGYGSNKVHLNTVARLWAYIQDKISSVLGLTSSAYGGKAASLNASAGGPSQPVYFPSSGADFGKPVAIPISTDPDIAAAGDFLTIQAQGAYYAHKAGNAATADAVSWVNVSGKPSKYPADITVGDSMTLTGINLESGKRWTAVTHGQTWSRILQGLPANFACTAILSLSATRANVVYNATFLICSTVAGFSEPFIAELGSGNYSKVRIRLVYAGSSGSFYVEIYDTANNISVGTEQSWKCTLYPLLGTSFNIYTSFVDGSTIPSGYTAIQELITAGGHSSVAIRNITFSGTTLTVTRQDGSTFTVSGLASDSSVVHLAGSETITGQKTFSGNLPQLSANSYKFQRWFLRGLSQPNYAEWSSAQKDNNHFRKWTISFSLNLGKPYNLRIKATTGWSNKNGVGSLEQTQSFITNSQHSFATLYNSCTQAYGLTAYEFRISQIYSENNIYKVDIVSKYPESDNTVYLDVELSTMCDDSDLVDAPTISAMEIIEGWPSWAGNINDYARLQSNERNVMLAGDNADSATDATYSTKIGSSSSHPAIGSATQPVYVDSDGAVQPCTLKGVYLSQYNADSLSNIIDAFDSGLLVFSKYAGDVYLLLDADSNGATFVCNTTVDGKTYYSTLTVNSSNTWSRTTESIFNNIIVRKHYGANHEASVITTATDISNGYVEYALDFTDMFFGGGNSILFISLPNESTLAYYFTSIEVMTYPYTTGQNSIDICKFTDLTHDDDGNAIGANDEYTWLRTCNSPNYIQRIKGLKLRCYLNTTSGTTWQAGIELKLKLDFNAVRFDKL